MDFVHLSLAGASRGFRWRKSLEAADASSDETYRLRKMLAHFPSLTYRLLAQATAFADPKAWKMLTHLLISYNIDRKKKCHT